MTKARARAAAEPPPAPYLLDETENPRHWLNRLGLKESDHECPNH
jgi:hypothetical protein